jgi:glycosyltransferase involved in cell wall biosynthesis
VNRRLRVLHCPELIGGNAGSLARAERQLGLESHCVSLAPHPFGYPADEILTRGGLVATQFARWQLLARAIGHFEIIHFNFGQSTMPQRIPIERTPSSRFPVWMRRAYNLYACMLELRDLRWLNALGKRIVVTYQGDDARQGAYLKAHFDIHPADEAGYYSAESDRLKRHRIEVFSRWADAIFALNPDLLHVLPQRARFLPYANADIQNIQPVGLSGSGTVPVVLHAPSHRGVKGTRFIVEAVNRLKAEGVGFDFLLLHDLPHAEAMGLYPRADLLVDQLLAGWYGGLAVELMALGKPVIAYIRSSDLGFLPDGMRDALPVINATPATIYSVLKEWLTTRRSELSALGARSRQFVEEWHDPQKIAAVLKKTYEQAVVCAA